MYLSVKRIGESDTSMMSTWHNAPMEQARGLVKTMFPFSYVTSGSAVERTWRLNADIYGAFLYVNKQYDKVVNFGRYVSQSILKEYIHATVVLGGQEVEVHGSNFVDPLTFTMSQDVIDGLDSWD